MELLLHTICHDEKGRFQIAGEVDQKGFLYDYFAIRAVSGHGIPWLEARRFACPLSLADLDHFGCITHVTTQQALAGIFRLGLIPGDTFEDNNRSETNFGLYFPNDGRRIIQGRVCKPVYDCTIIFDKERLAQNCKLFLAPNGVLLTKDTISPLSFFSIVQWDPAARDYRLYYHQLFDE